MFKKFLPVLNNRNNIPRARRNDDDDSSLDSDATLELHLSDGKGEFEILESFIKFCLGAGQLSEPDFDSDSSLSVAYDDPSSDLNISTNNISDIWNNSRFDSDTDSSDEEFRTTHNDTDSVSGKYSDLFLKNRILSW